MLKEIPLVNLIQILKESLPSNEIKFQQTTRILTKELTELKVGLQIFFPDEPQHWLIPKSTLQIISIHPIISKLDFLSPFISTNPQIKKLISVATVVDLQNKWVSFLNDLHTKDPKAVLANIFTVLRSNEEVEFVSERLSANAILESHELYCLFCLNLP